MDVLCLDKTGTITTGKMQVSGVKLLDEAYPAESALAALAGAMGPENQTMAAIAERFPDGTGTCLKKEPFSSARKWSGAQVEGFGTLILGAPSFVLPPEEYAELSGECSEYSGKGQRVLLLAHSEEPLPGKALPGGLSPKALVILSDEIRESAPETLHYFREQGVTLKVISGDDPVTVSNVALKAGLPDAGKYVDASLLSDEDIPQAASEYAVFGRVTPAREAGACSGAESRRT